MSPVELADGYGSRGFDEELLIDCALFFESFDLCDTKCCISSEISHSRTGKGFHAGAAP